MQQRRDDSRGDTGSMQLAVEHIAGERSPTRPDQSTSPPATTKKRNDTPTTLLQTATSPCEAYHACYVCLSYHQLDSLE